MSGRGDNLADVIRKELASMFAPVAAIPPRAMPLDLSADVTYCVLSPACPVNNVMLKSDAPQIREGLGEFGMSEFARVSPLLPAEAALASVHCEWEPIACHAPMFHPALLPTRGVSFDSLLQESQRIPVSVPIQSWSATGRGVPIPRYQTTVRELRPARFQIAQKNRVVSSLKARSYEMPASVWGQPIQKNAIPNHRFSAALKDRFRKTLAAKAQTVSANIQIRQVFDRMNMALYENIEQDKPGRLQCYPKSRYIGKNWARYQSEADRKPMYLVFGTVMNTGQNVSALVSADPPAEEPS